MTLVLVQLRVFWHEDPAIGAPDVVGELNRYAVQRRHPVPIIRQRLVVVRNGENHPESLQLVLLDLKVPVVVGVEEG